MNNNDAVAAVSVFFAIMYDLSLIEKKDAHGVFIKWYMLTSEQYVYAQAVWWNDGDETI